MESRDSKLIADGRAWSVDGRAQALVGPGLATPLSFCSIKLKSHRVSVHNFWVEGISTMAAWINVKIAQNET